MLTKLHILTSTQTRFKNFECFLDTLYGVDKKFHTLQIATCYLDEKLESIEQAIAWAKKRKSLRPKARFELFLNSTKRTETVKKLKHFNIEIKKEFPHENSGIYLVERCFFHMKAYHIRGTTKAVLSIGSNNFTQNSILSNEEAMMSLTFDPRRSQSSGHKRVDVLLKYFENLKINASENRPRAAVRVDEWDKLDEKCDSLTEYLLDNGELWTELGTSSPYQLKLYLPEDLLKAAPNREVIATYMDADTPNALSVKKLIDRCRNEEEKDYDKDVVACYQSVRDQHKLDELGEGKVCWKQYAIETSLGFWAPSKYGRCIEKELGKQKHKEIDHLANLEVLRKLEYKFKKKFMNFVEEIINIIGVEELSPPPDSPWFIGQSSKVRDRWSKRWDDHIENLKKKLSCEQVRNRLVRGTSSIPVPDMRSDELVLKQFVRSFVLSFDYYLGMKKISKRLCQDSDVKQLVENHKVGI